MTMVMLLLHRFLIERAGETLLRGGIIALTLGTGRWLSLHWPQLANDATIGFKNTFYPLLVYAFFFWLICLIFGPTLLAITGMRGPARQLRTFIIWIGFRVSKITLMTLVNLAVLLVRVGASAFLPGNALQTLVDAGTHFAEREADLILNPTH